ncbi:MAG: hypothetical protein A3G18_06355 [Rhodospirillales bacterium RIFCSPLOWO2_12_FULL_58_28]|nr:MAG: hypothetical protein A3H92_04170 [Rhodospirillales bacterium RIFCSPLOWO2_02_FULL_58_16]OHC76805.1 MAG: hypothetical protein A3G18_06355 [Rhodospirillales bacterium RIFCSPLOWO2_12_FULL_58_28]
MKNDKINYLVVGCFVLIMLVGLVYSIAMLSGRTIATDAYYVIYKNVTGVKFGTQVLYEGFPIGQVEEVTPVVEDGGMRFRVDFNVKKGWRIPDDSISEIAAPGLLSAITLSIHAGVSKQALKPGDIIAGREAANLFAVMSSVAGQITELAENSLRPLLESVRKTTESFGGLMEGNAEVLLKELSSLAREMSQRLPKIAADIESFSGKMNSSSDELSAFLSTDNRVKMEALLTNMNAASENFARLSGDLGKTRGAVDDLLLSINSTVVENKSDIKKSLTDLRHVVDSVARHIDSVNQNMEGAARNMYEFSRQIRQNPGLLLGGVPPKDEATVK